MTNMSVTFWSRLFGAYESKLKAEKTLQILCFFGNDFPLDFQAINLLQSAFEKSATMSLLQVTSKTGVG